MANSGPVSSRPPWSSVAKIADYGLCGLAATALFSMMLLTVADVFGRDALNAPVPGAFEVTELLMVVVIFSALPTVTANDEHVTIDFIDLVLPASVRSWHAILVDAISLVALALVTRQIWEKAVTFERYGDTTMLLLIPLAPFAYFMAILSGAATVALMIRVARRLVPQSRA